MIYDTFNFSPAELLFLFYLLESGASIYKNKEKTTDVVKHRDLEREREKEREREREREREGEEKEEEWYEDFKTTAAI